MRWFEAHPEGIRRNRWMSTLVLLVGVFLFTRGGGGEPPTMPVIEIRGQVAAPGFYEVDPALDAALAAAGEDGPGWPALALQHGDRVEVGADGLRVIASPEALALGLPVDINAATVDGLATLPGLGPKRAAAVVQDREQKGPFRDIDDLDRVKGIGPGTIEKLAELATVGLQAPDREIARAPTSR